MWFCKVLKTIYVTLADKHDNDRDLTLLSRDNARYMKVHVSGVLIWETNDRLDSRVNKRQFLEVWCDGNLAGWSSTNVQGVLG